MKAVVLAALLAISGCAVMSKMMGDGVVSSWSNSFDGSTTVQVTPGNLYAGPDEPIMFGMGALWNSAAPEFVTLVYKYEPNLLTKKNFVNFSMVKISIDGDVTDHEFEGLTDHEIGSYNSVTGEHAKASVSKTVVPMAMLRKMVESADVKMRVITQSGAQDILFSSEKGHAGAPAAIVAIREFLGEVEKVSKI